MCLPGKNICKISFGIFFVLSFFISSSVAFSESEKISAQEIIKQATDQKLAQDPQWLKLVHAEYQTKTPLDILNETIRGFFESDKPQAENPLCLLPARLTFLAKHLPLESLKQKQKFFCAFFKS